MKSEWLQHASTVNHNRQNLRNDCGFQPWSNKGCSLRTLQTIFYNSCIKSFFSSNLYMTEGRTWVQWTRKTKENRLLIQKFFSSFRRVPLLAVGVVPCNIIITLVNSRQATRRQTTVNSKQIFGAEIYLHHSVTYPVSSSGQHSSFVVYTLTFSCRCILC